METTPDVLARQLEKFSSTNPIAAALVARFLRDFRDLVRATGAKSSLEVGCGEGELLKILVEEGASPFGIDINEQELDLARRRLEGIHGFRGVAKRDLYGLGPSDRNELVVCCEVLEHLEDPHRALKIVASLASPWLIVSVPREPIWRMMNMARGKYWSDWGNTPSHINHWSLRSFVKKVGERLDIVAVRRPLPWTMILARR